MAATARPHGLFSLQKGEKATGQSRSTAGSLPPSLKRCRGREEGTGGGAEEQKQSRLGGRGMQQDELSCHQGQQPAGGSS